MKPIQKALDLLAKEQIQEAFEIFGQECSKTPDGLEARMGILLCDIARSNRPKALSLLEFYFAMLDEKDAMAAEKILNIIQAMDAKDNSENESLSLSNLQNAESLSCISYEDFKAFVLSRPDFKEAFEDFSLSTKIIFSHKEELYAFLNLLIDKGYANLSFQYAQNIGENMGFDVEINQILQRALKHIK